MQERTAAPERDGLTSACPDEHAAEQLDAEQLDVEQLDAELLDAELLDAEVDFYAMPYQACAFAHD